MSSNRNLIRRLIAGCAASAALLMGAPAMASGVAPGEASSTQTAEAMGHFMAGKQAIEQKSWERAARELRASLEVVNSPNARLVLARALRDSGNLAEAWTEYGHTIDDAAKLSAKEERYAKTAEAATGERAELEPKVALLAVTLAHVPTEATLKAAGRAVPVDQWSGPIVVPAGAVDVVLTDASGKELARQTVSAAVGKRTAVTLDAQPAPLPPPRAPKEPAVNDNHDEPTIEPLPEASNTSKLRPSAYVAGGVGVVGLALFAGFGLKDNATFSDLQTACPHNTCPPGKQGEVDSGRTQQTVANVSLVVGAVGVATGVTLFVLSLSPKSATGTGTGLVVAPGYLGLRGSL